MKKGIKLFSILLLMSLLLFVSLSAVSAVTVSDDLNSNDMGLDDVNAVSNSVNFTQFQSEIDANDVINLSSNVIKEDGEKDLVVNKTLTIDGKGYSFDANNVSSIFRIQEGANLTLKNVKLINTFNSSAINIIGANCTLINCTFSSNIATDGAGIYAKSSSCYLFNCIFSSNAATDGAGIYANSSSCYLFNCIFSSNSAKYGAGIYANSSSCYLFNCTFSLNTADFGAGIRAKFGSIKVFNCTFKDSKYKWGAINTVSSILNVSNSNFYNLVSDYATAIGSESSEVFVDNCSFWNLKAQVTAGAIGVKDTNFKLSNCEFINTTSIKNAGAIFFDIFQNPSVVSNITSSSFTNCSSGFGGAIVILSVLNSTIEDCNFTENFAEFNGGAIYTSFAKLNIINGIFKNNEVNCTNNTSNIVNYGNGGALYLDYSDINLIGCKLIDNSVSYQGGAIYTYDGMLFLNNTDTSGNSKDDVYGIYNVFLNNFTAVNSNIDDTLLFNSTFYATVIVGSGVSLTLVNDTVVIKNYTRFDLRDYGWVTAVKDQGNMGACWTFGTTAAIESALLRKTNTTYNFSVNNMQNSMIRFNILGDLTSVEGEFSRRAASYALSWLGEFSSNYDSYDELGKLSTMISTKNAIHMQDVMFISDSVNGSSVSDIKNALLKYGAVTVEYYQDDAYYNKSSYGYYYNGTGGNHVVCIVGWDDSYSKDNFNIKPAGDGAFIVKNSWGTDFGDEGYFYISYYNFLDDLSVYIVNNTVSYNKNYQFDFSGLNDFDSNYTYYMNRFVSVGNDSIAAVGTYFNDVDVDYEINVYVNGVLVHTQSGLSPFYGYSTIKLTDNINVCENDIIEVHIRSNSVPMSTYNRNHIVNGTSCVSRDGKNWINCDDNTCVCLKVYTIQDYVLNVTDAYLFNSTDGVVVVDVPVDINGTLNIIVNGVSNIVDIDDNRTFHVKGLIGGLNNITLCYKGNEKYIPLNKTSWMDVSKLDADLNVVVNDVIYGDNITVLISLFTDNGEVLSDNVTLRIAGKFYNVEIVEGKGSIIINNLSVGNYCAVVYWNGTDIYNGVINGTVFNVSKTNANLTLYISDASYGVMFSSNFMSITLKGVNGERINGTVILSYDGVLKSYTVRNGFFYGYLGILDSGNYTASVFWSGNDNYNGANATTNFTVKPVITSLNASVNSIVYGENATLSIMMDPGLNVPVSVYINGRFYKDVGLIDGFAQCELNNLNAGNYSISVVFKGSKNYITSTASIICNVDKANTTFIMVVEDDNGEKSIIVNVGDYLSGVAIISGLYPIETCVKVIDGVGVLKCSDLERGNYTLNGEFIPESSNFNVVYNSTSFIVVDKNIYVVADDFVKYYGNESRFVAYLVDGEGNPVINKTLTFNINGVFYKRITDENGSASLGINLNVGVYPISVSYNSTIKKYVDVVVLSTVEGNDTTLMYRNGTRYVAVFKDGAGNVLSNVNVTFNINGVFYNRVTDSEGKASLVINLDAGDYVITAYNSVTGQSFSNNIKVLPILVGSDLSMIYGQKAAYEVKVFDGQGNPLANVTVVININGVFYNRVSDVNGVARLNINLAPGEYVATASYNGFLTSNKITVF